MKKHFDIPSVAVALALAALASSCAFIRLKGDLNTMDSLRNVHGAITVSPRPKSPLVIVAYNSKRNPVAFKKLAPDTDYYLFHLHKNAEFSIVAFEDENGNSKYDVGEPAETAEISKGDAAETLNLALAANNTLPKELDTDISKMTGDIGEKAAVAVGTVTSLDNPLFDAEHAKKGLWTPHAFLSEHGLGVYFLETYDPAKTPVLFVYGIEGYPRSWKKFIDSLDYAKYQAWVYFYPTGYHIPKAGKALEIVMEQLHDKFHFKKLFIVAHSMGGLVSKEYIKRAIAKGEADHIKLFLTLATPWNGDKDAVWATRAPVAVPSWIDMAPNSDFIKNSTAKDLGDEIPYYLFFSFKGDRKPFRFNNDNVITIRSALRWDMEKRAEKVYGFDTTHTGILTYDEAIKTCLEIFEKHKND